MQVLEQHMARPDSDDRALRQSEAKHKLQQSVSSLSKLVLSVVQSTGLCNAMVIFLTCVAGVKCTMRLNINKTDQKSTLNILSLY